MKIKLFATAVVLASVCASGVALGNNKAAGSGPNPFVDCGIGAALFPNTHWAAVTSNVIWDIGTTAVTSATMSPETCSGKRLAAAMFINDTYESLAEETARGEGQHLTALLNIMECNSSQHAAAIGATRSGMSVEVAREGFESQSHTEKAAGFYSAMDAAVSRHCAA